MYGVTYLLIRAIQFYASWFTFRQNGRIIDFWIFDVLLFRANDREKHNKEISKENEIKSCL